MGIYLDVDDRVQFLEIHSDVKTRFNCVNHAYCLMDSHYPLLVKTPKYNFSQGMLQSNRDDAIFSAFDRGGYTMK